MVRLLIVALQGFGILLYSIVELQRPGDENPDWLVQCKQSKHGLISENYRHVPCSMQQERMRKRKRRSKKLVGNL